MSKAQIQIDIVSDIVCPWCIIGYKRLEKALELISDQVQANIHWHPFELNPNMQEGGENLRSHLAAKYGTTLEGSIKARANLTQMGAELGFTFNYFDEMKMFNTFKAHQLVQYARKYSKEQDLILRLFSAFFGEAKEIDQMEVLVKEAEAVGLDVNEARFSLEEAQYASLVREEENEWKALGIHSVPTYVINKKQAISGAQSPELLSQILLEEIN